MDELLDKVARTHANSLFKVGLIGIEKETLRVDAAGVIAGTPHPESLGSALTHPCITTDYSEALLEFVTPPLPDSERALAYLGNLQSYVSSKIGSEYLWPASMPCRLNGEQSIHIAEYGSSNLGKMKHVYRRGLGYRYGKTMQVIAGVHVNLSIDESFWCIWQELLEDSRSRQDFISDQYFVLIRNLQRIGWLVPYLFGASPAVDRSFQHIGVSSLQTFDPDTLYQPFATSLRLGDIGYTNHKENEIGVKACYDNLAAYVKCLTRAIETPCAEYEKIGVKVGGEYLQLNANLLQIENEYYSTVRPKQPGYMNEKPTQALIRRGVKYVEMRSLDLNPYHPLGVGTEQLKFIELLFLYCLVSSPQVIDKKEREEIDLNESLVAHRGREPGLKLLQHGKQRLLKDWATEVLHNIRQMAVLIENGYEGSEYVIIVDNQLEKVAEPELTPSAKLLREMRSSGLSYFEFIRELAQQHRQSIQAWQPDKDTIAELDAKGNASRNQQAALESIREKDFNVFLAEYFAQSLGERHEDIRT